MTMTMRLPVARRTVRRIGTAVRAVSGVDESVFEGVPGERIRYTALSTIIINTALFSSLSMGVAIHFAIGDTHWSLTLFTAAAWGLFVLSVDRWLISSTIPGRFLRRLAVCLPRLALAGVIGLIIAEPLMLAVFQGPIATQIAAYQAAAIARLDSGLRQCNPVPGDTSAAPPPSASCAGLELTVPQSPGDSDVLASLAAATAQTKDLQAVVDSDIGTYNAISDLARRECDGESGPGLTGTAGVGVNCTRLRAEANQYRQQTRLDANLAQLHQLQSSVATLTGKAATARAAFVSHREWLITQSVQGLRDRQQEIGLLERFAALTKIGRHNSQLALTQWLIRLLIVLVEAMPTISRVAIGRGAVDRITDERQRIAETSVRMSRQRHERDAALARQELVLKEEMASMRLQSEWDVQFEKSVDELLGNTLPSSPADHPVRLASRSIRQRTHRHDSPP